MLPALSTPRVWFITGTSTGLGRTLAEIVLERNEIVVATLRKPAMLNDLVAKYHGSRILVLTVDVTNAQQVANAFTKAKDTFGRIDVVVNNAGVCNLGEVESIEDKIARSVIETNFWGALTVTKEAMKAFREYNPPGAGGHLLQISSYLGLVGSPGLAFYVASKFALEGLTETLAMELDPKWNIKLTLIEPGYVISEFVTKVEETWSKPHPAYESSPDIPTTKWRRDGCEVEWKDTRRSVELFYRITSLPNPPLLLVVGRDAISATREKVAAVGKTLDEYESWSEGLELKA